jgi:uncharacterized protein (DUF927 family)/phage/plasmid primase-like uncharacterized protein
MTDPVPQFRNALEARGIVPPAEIVADGRIHRCDVAGNNGRGDAAYLLYLDGVPAGGFENWKDGRGWENWRADLGRSLTSSEEAAFRASVETARREREAADADRKANARATAARMWAAAQPCDRHPYLVKKQIQAHGTRLKGDLLVVPLRDTQDVLHSLQFIDSSGEKRFLPDGRKRGCFFLLGQPTGVLCLAEGFATAASVHEATGYAVAVAFDAGNLLPVAEGLRARYPNLRMFVCADDDHRTKGNPGRARAREAAQAVGATVAVPDFGGNRPDAATDFNDLHQLRGLAAVQTCVDAAAPACEGADPEGPARCDYGGGYFESTPRGVVFVGHDRESHPLPPQWICSPLAVVAKTRDAKSGEWGRLLRWQDGDGKPHEWAMPMELLQGDGGEVRCELARRGLEIAPTRGARERLTAYLNVWPARARARCVDRIGWHGAVYVTPSASFGEETELVVFQNAQAIEPAFSVAGTLDEWRDSVAALAVGNSRLVFALSIAFAGALPALIDGESGGFHFRGASSSGKTTLLKVAASVWGPPSEYPRLWRATTNGLEGLAALHNDGLLILDELSQIDPRQAGEAAYLLANGQGKVRASRAGTARPSARWRLFFLSAGEESLEGLMARVGQRVSAGQEIRLADLDADAGAGKGAFEDLHGVDSAASFALRLADAAAQSHGAVGRAWIEHLVNDRPELPAFILDGIRQFAEEVAPADAEGQVLRVVRRFALVAVAGELATHYALTGWQEGEASQAARRCFATWLEGFGGAGNREERAILSRVRLFFETHGASRFESMNERDGVRIPNRAGFVRNDGGCREYLVLPEVFRQEICQGFDSRRVGRVLRDRDWLQPDTDGRPQQKPRLPGMGPTRCYVFTSRMWEDDQ